MEIRYLPITTEEHTIGELAILDDLQEQPVITAQDEMALKLEVILEQFGRTYTKSGNPYHIQKEHLNAKIEQTGNFMKTVTYKEQEFLISGPQFKAQIETPSKHITTEYVLARTDNQEMN